MYLIDESYFTNKLYISNINEPNTDLNEEVNDYIEDKVRLFLENCLGLDLFEELDSFIIDGVLVDTAPLNWKNLVNGCKYVNNGTNYRFKGLLQTNGGIKKSLLANYTFYHWLEDNVTQQSGIGEVVTNGKNAINANSTQRLTSVWNEFVTLNQEGNLNYPVAYRKGCTRVVDWLGNANSANVSLITFLQHNQEDYKGFQGMRYEYKNQIGFK